MKILALISQKGGAGQTTLALNLAVAAVMDGKQTAVIDLDPQTSATDWGDSREKETPVVVAAVANRLTKVLEAAASSGADLAVIDTAPHSESASLAAARAADLVLIPCRPSILDLRAIGTTVDLINLAQAQASIILNAVPPRGNLADDAEQAVAQYNIPVLPVRIGERAAFYHSLTASLSAPEYEPKSKASREIQQVYKLICKQIYM